MSTIRRILVPTDFSDAAENAARYAVALASSLGAEVVLIHAWQLSSYSSPDSELARSMQADLERDLAELEAKLAESHVAITRHVRLGAPDSEILECAEEFGADLIVMGTTGKTGLEHFMLGSVAERIVRAAKCPVLTVRHHR